MTRRYRLAPSVLRTELEGGDVLYDATHDRYHELNLTATMFLDAVVSGESTEAATAMVAEAVGMDRSAVRPDLERLERELLDLGIIAVVE